MDSTFNAYSRYYDLLYRDKDYAGEAIYIENLLTQHGIVKGDLLEFGSGTGKHGCLLAARGHTVHGIERSQEMVDKAEILSGFTCQQGDIVNIKMGRQYDAVLSLFHVMSYQTNNTQLQTIFQNASEHLNPDGLFIFDFWYSPAVYAQKPLVRVKRMEDEQFEITRIAEPSIFPNENRVDVQYTIVARDMASNTVETFKENHPMRHFSLTEIDLLARYNGFACMTAEEFLTGRIPSDETWGVCVVLKKMSHE